jgi:hypothetical protein
MLSLRKKRRAELHPQIPILHSKVRQLRLAAPPPKRPRLCLRMMGSQHGQLRRFRLPDNDGLSHIVLDVLLAPEGFGEFEHVEHAVDRGAVLVEEVQVGF